MPRWEESMVRESNAERGELLCLRSDLDATGAVGIERQSEPFEIVVVRADGVVQAFINSCPHKGTPLEMFPGRFLDETGKQLICSTHGARFNVVDGICTFGPCVGEALHPVNLLFSGENISFDPDQFNP